MLASLFFTDDKGGGGGGMFDNTTELAFVLSTCVGRILVIFDLWGCIDISGRIITKFLESLTICEAQNPKINVKNTRNINESFASVSCNLAQLNSSVLTIWVSNRIVVFFWKWSIAYNVDLVEHQFTKSSFFTVNKTQLMNMSMRTIDTKQANNFAYCLYLFTDRYNKCNV